MDYNSERLKNLLLTGEDKKPIKIYMNEKETNVTQKIKKESALAETRKELLNTYPKYCRKDEECVGKGYLMAKLPRSERKCISAVHMCQSCMSKHITELRIKGQYEEWERKIMLAQAQSWLDDEWEKSVHVEKEMSNNPEQTFVFETGMVEKWSVSPEGQKALLEKIREYKNELIEYAITNKLTIPGEVVNGTKLGDEPIV